MLLPSATLAEVDLASVVVDLLVVSLSPLFTTVLAFEDATVGDALLPAAVLLISSVPVVLLP